MSHLDKDDFKQIEKIMEKYSDKVKDKILQEVAGRDIKNAQITEIQWYMALGLGVMLASPAFIDKQNAAKDWWMPVFIFLAGYVLFIYPGLVKFYKKYINKRP